MSNDYLKRFASELKSIRESKKISIDHIFTKTRIDKKYLAAIEEGNFSVMPEVYIRAFIKEYAKTIGQNPEETLSNYDKAKEGIDFSDNHKDEAVEEEKPSKEQIKKKINQAVKIDQSEEVSVKEGQSNRSLLFLLTAIGMLLTIFIVYTIFLNEDNNQIVTETPFEDIIQDNSENSTANNKVLTDNSTDNLSKIEPKEVEMIGTTKNENESHNINQPSFVNDSKNDLVLSIVGKTKSWIRVVSDEINNTEFILDSGMTKILSANNKFYLHIGNSGGIQLLLNNKDLNFTGATGKVRKIYVTKNGIEYLRRTPTTINAE